MSQGILSLMNRSKYQSNPHIPLYTEVSRVPHTNIPDIKRYPVIVPPPTSDLHQTERSSVRSMDQTPNKDDNDPLRSLTGSIILNTKSSTSLTEIDLNNIKSSDSDSYQNGDDHNRKNGKKEIVYYADKDKVQSSTEGSVIRKLIPSGSDTFIQSSNSSQRRRPKQQPSLRSSPDTLSLGTVESVSPCSDDKSMSEHEDVDGKDMGYEYQRIFDMINLRCQLAKADGSFEPHLRKICFDDKYVGTYSKGLPHDSNGFVDQTEMIKLITALKERDSKKLAQVKLGSKLRLVNPSAAWSQELFGQNNNSYRYSKLPSLSSEKMAAQMVELYCMSLSRDIPFHQYRTSALIADCCKYINTLKYYPQVADEENRTKSHVCCTDPHKVTPYNIFRGPMYGDLQGPYISQFLYRDMKMGGFIQKQKYPTILEGYDFMKAWDPALAAQSGNITESRPPHREISRYIITGRDLACYVRADEPYQAFYNTCVILLDQKVPMNPGISKLLSQNPTEGFFVDLGRADIQTTLAMVGRAALSACWYVKWNTLFLRPEAYGIEVERVYRDRRNKFGVSPTLLDNAVLQAVRSRNGTALLSQVYEEGAPTHPSTPSGHAAIAGACVTVLKFFFDSKHEIDIYEPDVEGQKLVNTGMKTTVGQELDKLASNIGIGRNWAGIHYWMDSISGIKIGEKVAISCLKDLIRRYPVHLEISLPRFNEKSVTISN